MESKTTDYKKITLKIVAILIFYEKTRTVKEIVFTDLVDKNDIITKDIDIMAKIIIIVLDAVIAVLSNYILDRYHNNNDSTDMHKSKSSRKIKNFAKLLCY